MSLTNPGLQIVLRSPRALAPTARWTRLARRQPGKNEHFDQSKCPFYAIPMYSSRTRLRSQNFNLIFMWWDHKKLTLCSKRCKSLYNCMCYDLNNTSLHKIHTIKTSLHLLTTLSRILHENTRRQQIELCMKRISYLFLLFKEQAKSDAIATWFKRYHSKGKDPW